MVKVILAVTELTGDVGAADLDNDWPLKSAQAGRLIPCTTGGDRPRSRLFPQAKDSPAFPPMSYQLCFEYPVPSVNCRMNIMRN
ncbi:hypothetical protein [Mesorhizobium sp.]|uniref:hypothetical protein n=1 Tax=Mesorhizobium sp. TaxID=1871066 RepID=UPI0025C06882|nr:hypothetical protein [Mesorhizobium sp.]